MPTKKNPRGGGKGPGGARARAVPKTVAAAVGPHPLPPPEPREDPPAEAPVEEPEAAPSEPMEAAARGAPRHGTALERPDDEVTRADLLGAYRTMERWAEAAAEYMDRITARQAALAERVAAVEGALPPLVEPLREELRAVKGALAALARAPAPPAPAAGPALPTPPQPIDQYLYHARLPARRVRTVAARAVAYGEGYLDSIQEAARRPDGSVDAALAQKIHARGESGSAAA